MIQTEIVRDLCGTCRSYHIFLEFIFAEYEKLAETL